jgi:uncharacterized protein YjdB
MSRSLRWLIFTGSVLLTLLVVAIGCGSPTLTAIDLTPAAARIARGTTQQFAATGTYSDGTTKDVTADVTWASSAVTLVTISDLARSKGLATGLENGEVTITASLVDGATITGTTKLTVADTAATLESLALTPASATVAKGTTLALTATGTYSDGATKNLTADATWASSDVTVATVAKGTASGLIKGTSTITATIGSIKGTLSFTVTDATLVVIQVTSPDGLVAKGIQEQFVAMGVFSDDTKQDLTTQAQWASSDPAISISNLAGSQGLGTAVSEGTTTVSATLLGVTGSMSFQVSAATLDTISVTPFDTTIAKGTTLAFSATGILTDNTIVNVTPFVLWHSSDDKLVKFGGGIFAAGVATAVDTGKVTISASYKALSGTTTLTVSAATLAKVTLVPQNPVVAKGTVVAFRAIGTFTDESAQDLTPLATWGSGSPAVASVSNAAWSQGVVTGLAEGTATITATIGTKSDATTVTITPAVLIGITVTPSFPTLAKGTSVQMFATGIYSDKTTQPLTLAATWTSVDPTIVAVSSAWSGAGVITGVGVGATSVKASFGGLTGATTVTISGATLTSIEVTPPDASIAKGTSLWLSATGIYSDKTTQDLTHWTVWKSSDASVAISNASATHGLALGQVEGTATITATFLGGVAGTTTVHVTAATLVSLAVTPQAPAIAKGTTVQLGVVGTYTDNSVQDLTLFANWQSSDPSVALGTALDAPGLATGVSQGAATVTAHVGGKNAATLVTVTAATLASLAVTPVNPTLAKGTALWLTVTGTYTDSTTQDLSSLATWSSADESRAVVSNVPGARGLVTGVGVGAATITADFGGQSATTSVAVTAATLVLVTVTPATPSVAKNGTKHLTALGTFTDSTMQNITNLVFWSSSAPATAVVSNAVGSKGLVTGVAAGPATISAGLGGKSGSALLTVTP